MGGSKAGGIKARETNLKKHGKDFYSRIGRIGGRNGHTGGFASNPELAKRAGRLGGIKGRRGACFIYTATSASETVKGSLDEVAIRLGYAPSTLYMAYKKQREFHGYKITREQVKEEYQNVLREMEKCC